MFGVFFSGGKGSINLQDAEDPLNSDVVFLHNHQERKIIHLECYQLVKSL